MSDIPGPFTEHAGVLWKRLPDGSIDASPYCPKCLKVMASLLSYQHFTCPECGRSSDFKRNELVDVMAQITSQK